LEQVVLQENLMVLLVEVAVSPILIIHQQLRQAEVAEAL
jgi:hypothetical protein